MRILPQRVSSNGIGTDGSSQPLLGNLKSTSCIDSDEDDAPLINANGPTGEQVGPDEFQGSQDSDPNVSDGYGTDSSPEEDVDDLVAQYREHLRVGTLDGGLPRTPTPDTAGKAALLVTSLIFIIAITAAVLIHSHWRNHGTAFAVTIVGGLLVVTVVILVALVALPVVRPPQGSSFSVVASPWLPTAAMFLNMILLTEVYVTTWPIMIPLQILGKFIL